MKPKTSIPFITAFQLLEISWRISKLVERWSLRFLYQSLVRQSNSPCCYYTNTCLHGQKRNYTVINQSDSSRRNSTDFKFVCMQVYQTLLLLRVRGSGSETSSSLASCGYGTLGSHKIGDRRQRVTEGILVLHLIFGEEESTT